MIFGDSTGLMLRNDIVNSEVTFLPNNSTRDIISDSRLESESFLENLQISD